MAYEIMTAMVVFRANCQCTGLLNVSATKGRRGGRGVLASSGGGAGRFIAPKRTDRVLNKAITAAACSMLVSTNCEGAAGDGSIVRAVSDPMACLQARS